MIVYGADDTVARWVSKGVSGEENIFDNYKAIGIVIHSRLIAGIVYHNYHPKLFIELSIYSVDKRWCNRHNLKAIFSYPFAQLKLERVQATCSAQDKGVQMFLERIGFNREGYHPKAHWDGGDAVSYGMLKPDCRWL